MVPKVGDLILYNNSEGEQLYGIIVVLGAYSSPPALPEDDWESGVILLDTEGFYVFVGEPNLKEPQKISPRGDK